MPRVRLVVTFLLIMVDSALHAAAVTSANFFFLFLSLSLCSDLVVLFGGRRCSPPLAAQANFGRLSSVARSVGRSDNARGCGLKGACNLRRGRK